MLDFMNGNRRRPRRRRRRRRPHTINLTLRKRRALMLMLSLAFFVAAMTPISNYLRKVSGQMALSDASDLVTMEINTTVADAMAQGGYDYDYFVTLQKDSGGNITAISANMAHINALSSQILRDVVDSYGSDELNVSIPVGNLSGSNMLLGRGPEIPVKIIMLTSSHADFRNELIAAGINQTRHQIILEVTVDVEVLMPWETLTSQITSQVLVAETVIVGAVPDTYFNMENDDGYTEGIVAAAADNLAAQ